MHYNESNRISIDYDLIYIFGIIQLRVLGIMLKNKLGKYGIGV